MTKAITQEMADNLLLEWQHRLGLDEWRIVIHPNRQKGELDNDVQGQTDFVEASKQAYVNIVDPKIYDGEAIIEPFDFEQTLVHELLHLKTSLVSWNVSDLQERVMHQIIDDLARAYVDAKRVYCDRNLCTTNEYNGVDCDECQKKRKESEE